MKKAAVAWSVWEGRTSNLIQVANVPTYIWTRLKTLTPKSKYFSFVILYAEKEYDDDMHDIKHKIQRMKKILFRIETVSEPAEAIKFVKKNNFLMESLLELFKIKFNLSSYFLNFFRLLINQFCVK